MLARRDRSPVAAVTVHHCSTYRGSDEDGHADDDLAVIGPEGSPSSAGISLDAEAVMDLGVVPFTQQRRILQRGLPTEDPMPQMMDVAPVLRRGAAGEHARLVAELDGPAQMRWHDPVAAAQVQRHAVLVDLDGDDAAVAGERPGLGGRDQAAEAGGGGGRT